jgi:hypothetical protein
MSKFVPMNETDYHARNTWPTGWYPATIIDCLERLSKNDNLMFETNFEIYNDDNKKIFVRAFIMADGKAAFQLRTAAEAFGVLDKYKDATLTEDDFKGRSGYVKLGVQVDKDGNYPDKNVITDYRKTIPGKVTAESVAAAMPAKKMTAKETAASISDDIPF